MKKFRDELLELLFNNVGEFISIQPLVEKYCGEGNTFDANDETMTKCRLGINLHLRELKDIGWINMNIPGGLSTGHSYNQDLGKRQFILDQEVKVRMTTKGEIEYKKSKQEQQPTHQHNYHAPVTGNFNSPNANLVTHSSDVSIQQNSNNIDESIKNIRDTIQESNNIDKQLAENILECLTEIEQNIKSGLKPKFAIKSLIDISGGIASIASWVTVLGQYAGLLPIPK